MEDKSVLDDWREQQPRTTDHYRRAIRFLCYNLGIIVLIGARIALLLLPQQQHSGSGYWWFRGVPDLISIGVAGVWLFSGLGLLAIFRARHDRPTDLIFALIVVAHLTTFIIASASFYRLFISLPISL